MTTCRIVIKLFLQSSPTYTSLEQVLQVVVIESLPYRSEGGDWTTNTVGADRLVVW